MKQVAEVMSGERGREGGKRAYMRKSDLAH